MWASCRKRTCRRVGRPIPAGLRPDRGAHPREHRPNDPPSTDFGLSVDAVTMMVWPTCERWRAVMMFYLMERAHCRSYAGGGLAQGCCIMFCPTLATFPRAVLSRYWLHVAAAAGRPMAVGMLWATQTLRPRRGRLPAGTPCWPRLRAGSGRPEQVVKLLPARCAVDSNLVFPVVFCVCCT